MPKMLEEDALQSVGSGIPVDRWPCYTLNDVSVLSESTKGPVSLCSGNKNHAVSVVGCLEEIPDAHAHLVLDPTCTLATTRFVVENVTSWTCARSLSDGSLKFYAVGKAGKYLIQNPDPRYETVFNQMRETASMFDFIETKLRKMREKTSDMGDSNMNNYAQLTFNEYLRSESNCLNRQSVGDVIASFHEYAEYIITMMLAGAGGSERLDWESSPMMEYCKQQCSEQNAKVRRRMNSTGPAKLSFQPNFQKPEPTNVRKRGRKELDSEADDFDTAEQRFPQGESDTEGPDAMRRSKRRAVPRAKASFVPMHGPPQDSELLENAAESNDEEKVVRNPRDSRQPSASGIPNIPSARPRSALKSEAAAAATARNPASSPLSLMSIPDDIPVDPYNYPSSARASYSPPQRPIGGNVANNPTSYLSPARNALSATTTTTATALGVPRDESGPASSTRRQITRRGLGGNTIQSSSPSSLINTRNVARSEVVPPDDEDSSSTAPPAPTTTRAPAVDPYNYHSSARASHSLPQRLIEGNIASNPATYLSPARNALSATTTTTTTGLGVPRDESGPASSTRRQITRRGLGGNTIQSSSPSSLTNTRNVARSEAVPPDDEDSSSTAPPAPTTTRAPARRRGNRRQY